MKYGDLFLRRYISDRSCAVTVIPRSFAVGRLKYYRIIFKCLGNGYLVFFKNDIWSWNIFFPFRIDRKIVEDKVFI